MLLDFIKTLFLIYIINFFIRWFYDEHKFIFLKQNWFEGLLILLLILDGFSLYLLKVPVLKQLLQYLNLTDYQPFYILFIQFYMMILAGREVIRIGQGIFSFRIKPATLMVLSFASLLAVGTGLLMLPEMTTQPGSMHWLDALFTSVSASCVTGLIVVDTGTFFTLKGQLVILMLMQLGGIGIVTFASFFALSFTTGSSIRYQTYMLDLLSSESFNTARSLLRKIIYYTLVFELIGAVMIYSLWVPDNTFFLNHDVWLKVYYSIFHSVSAFCNAGFSLFPDSLMNHFVMAQPMMQMAFALLIILGGLGFPALQDLFGREALRERMRKPWRDWQVATKVAVYSALVLIITGAVLFYLLENHNTLEGQDGTHKVILSIFQSVTTRTAGFNSVDISAISTPTVIMFLVLMFIGGSSGGTAGGIKTSTFVVIMTSVFGTIRGKKQLTLGKRSISYVFLNRAYSIVAFASIFVVLAISLLTIFEPDKDLTDLVFEEFSAFGTVGLSRGITSALSDAGKVVIIFSMYLGRLGTLTLAYALSRPVRTNAYKYPQTHMMVG